MKTQRERDIYRANLNLRCLAIKPEQKKATTESPVGKKYGLYSCYFKDYWNKRKYMWVYLSPISPNGMPISGYLSFKTYQINRHLQ